MRVLPLILFGLVCAGCSPGTSGKPPAAADATDPGRTAVIEANAGKLTEGYCLGVATGLAPMIAQAVGPDSAVFRDAMTYLERREASLLAAKGVQALEDLETADPAISSEIERGTRWAFAQVASSAGIVQSLTGPEREKMGADLKSGAPPFDTWAQCRKAYPAGG